MSSTIQICYVDAKTEQKVKFGKQIKTELSAPNVAKVFSFYDSKTGQAPKDLFRFNQNEITVSQKICSKV